MKVDPHCKQQALRGPPVFGAPAVSADGHTVTANSHCAASELLPQFIFQPLFQLSHRRVCGFAFLSVALLSAFFALPACLRCPRRSATFPRLVSMPHGPLFLCLQSIRRPVALDAASHVFNLTFHLILIHDFSFCLWTSSKRLVPACFRAWRSVNSEYGASALD